LSIGAVSAAGPNELAVAALVLVEALGFGPPEAHAHLGDGDAAVDASGRGVRTTVATHKT
jgi:hypothetical protein